MATNVARAYGHRIWPVLNVAPVKPEELTIISRAQSILTMDGVVGPQLSLQHAKDVIKWHLSSPRKDL